MMFPTTGYPQVPMSFGFSAQQAPNALYQSQFGGYGGFNPQMMAPYQTAPAVTAVPPRGQSMPATGRQYPQPPTGPFSPGPSGWPRRQQNEQYPPPAPSQHYEHHGTHGSKSKRRSKRRSVSPGGAGDPGLYSDKERREASEGPKGHHSRSPSPSGVSRSKQEVVDNNQQQTGQASDNTGQDAGQHQAGTTLGVARSEEEQAVGEHERRKSSSKKKKSHRRDRYEQFNAVPTAPGMPIDANGQNPFQPAYPGQAFLQQPPNFNEYQNELPPQLKVHRQPLYSGYTQAYEESIRRGDIFRKQAKRSTRLPPEVKQQLLPHEDDQQNQPTPQQHYPYASAPGYPPPGPQGQPLQTFNGMRPPYNPYQTYGSQQTYYGQPSGPAPYNAIQPWSAAPIPPSNSSAEQEIQRLRSHIHTLEGELHKLQKKLNKTSLYTQNNEETEQNERQTQESGRSHRRSKRDEIVSPRQTPVIVELNSTAGESVRESSKKHRRRTGSTASSQKGPNPAQQDPHPTQHVSTASNNVVTTTATAAAAAATVEQSRGTTTTTNATVHVESEDRQAKVTQPKTSREETAAQLAHAAAAHVNGRQAVNVAAPPVNVVGPVPPNAPRPQVPMQQQYIHQQQVAARAQAPQIRGPAPRLPGPPQANIRFPLDPYRPPMPQQVQPAPNPNYNQSNNNELFNDDDEVPCGSSLNQEDQHRDAEKILDAFERFYLNRGKNSSTPMKVKFIPEDSNSNPKSANYFYHGNTNNNNNRHYSTSKQSRSQSSSSSSSSSSESMYSSSPVSSRRSAYDNDHRKMASVNMDPCL